MGLDDSIVSVRCLLFYKFNLGLEIFQSAANSVLLFLSNIITDSDASIAAKQTRILQSNTSQ